MTDLDRTPLMLMLKKRYDTSVISKSINFVFSTSISGFCKKNFEEYYCRVNRKTTKPRFARLQQLQAVTLRKIIEFFERAKKRRSYRRASSHSQAVRGEQQTDTTTALLL